MRLAPWNWFKPSSKIFYWPFQGGTSFVDLLWFCSVLYLLCLCARLFICALWSAAGNGLTSWLSFVVSNCEFVTFPLISRVRCGTWFYRFLIFAPLLILSGERYPRWLTKWPVPISVRCCGHSYLVIFYQISSKELRVFRDYFGPYVRTKNTIRFSPILLISLLEQWPRCIRLILVWLLPLLW